MNNRDRKRLLPPTDRELYAQETERWLAVSRDLGGFGRFAPREPRRNREERRQGRPSRREAARQSQKRQREARERPSVYALFLLAVPGAMLLAYWAWLLRAR